MTKTHYYAKAKNYTQTSEKVKIRAKSQNPNCLIYIPPIVALRLDPAEKGGGFASKHGSHNDVDLARRPGRAVTGNGN